MSDETRVDREALARQMLLDVADALYKRGQWDYSDTIHAVLALLPAPRDECPHLAESGDEGPVRELHGGLMTVVRWRCDGCGRIRYDNESLDRLRALFAATTERLAALARPAPHPQGAGDVVAEMDAEITAAALETRCRLVVAASDRFMAERDAARIEIQRLEGVLESTRADRDMFALLAAVPAPTEAGDE